MIKYIAMRLVWMVMIWFIIVALIFAALEYAMWSYYISPLSFGEFLQQLIKDYFSFISGVLTRWDWGTDRFGNPYTTLILRGMSRTIRINAVALVVYIGGGIGFGIASAMYARTLFDKALNAFLLIMAAVPNYIWVFIFIIVLGYQLKVFPRMWPSQTMPLHVRMAGYIIPVASMAFVPIARFTALVRAETLEMMRTGYVDLLRSKGLRKRQIVFRHLLRDSIYPILPVLPSTFIFVMTSSFLIEMVYNVQGVARLLFMSLFNRFDRAFYLNVNVELSTLLLSFYVALALLMVLAADIALMALDPRIRMNRKAS